MQSVVIGSLQFGNFRALQSGTAAYFCMQSEQFSSNYVVQSQKRGCLAWSSVKCACSWIVKDIEMLLFTSSQFCIHPVLLRRRDILDVF